MQPCKRHIKSPFPLLAIAAFTFSACAGQQSALLPAAAPGGAIAQIEAAHPGSARVPVSNGAALHVGRNGMRSAGPMTAAAGLTVTGQIVQAANGGFLIAVSQGCSSSGNGPTPIGPPKAQLPPATGVSGRQPVAAQQEMLVATNSATTIMGGVPTVGLYAEATGSGSCSIQSSQAPATPAPVKCLPSSESVACASSLYPSITATTVTLSRVPLGQPCTNQPPSPIAVLSTKASGSVNGTAQGCTNQPCSTASQTATQQPVGGVCPTASPVVQQTPSPAASASPPAPTGSSTPAPAATPTPAATATPTPGSPH